MRIFQRIGLFAFLTVLLTAGDQTRVHSQLVSPPILLVTNEAAPNVFGPYLAEILRAEGVTSFATASLASLSESQLTAVPLVVLAETPLTPAQATLLTTYVNGGGRLVAMRPDPALATVLGIAQTGSSAEDGYLRIDTGQASGAGLPSATLPFRGSATRYTLNGGTAVAALYTDRDTASPYPAVIRHGRTITWAFDLARSVAYTRQGDPAVGGTEQDGEPPVRTTDVFFGDIDLERVQTPHADMLMRLFSRGLQDLLLDTAPLPRLWYFPADRRTVLIATSDTHVIDAANTAQLIASVEARGGRLSTYVSRYTMLGAGAQMAAWRAAGHEFGVHPFAYMDGVTLDAGYTTAEDWFSAQGLGTPSVTTRHHQIEWAGWTTAALVAAAHGIRLDTSFYTWGPSVSFTDTHPNGARRQAHGYINGSGLPMRFVNEAGTVLPVYQQTTSLIDEQLLTQVGSYSENLTPAQGLAVSQQLIDESQAGGYSAITTQFHADYYMFGEVKPWVDGTLDYAASLGIPIWTAERWLRFTEARAATTLGPATWASSTRQLSFEVTIPAGAEPQSVILPATYAGRLVSSVTVDGAVAPFLTQTISGRSTAFVTVQPRLDGLARQILATYNDTAPNQPPIAVGDSATTPLDTAVSIPVLANDSDPDGDALTVVAVGSAARGVLTITGGGTAVQYTPTTGLCGTDSSTYTVGDGRGGTAQASITVTVSCPANQPPLATADTAATPLNAPVTIAVLLNDADPDADPLVVTAVSVPGRGTAAIAPGATAVIYTPSTGLCGPDGFTYTISDGRGGTATANVSVAVGCSPELAHTTVTDFAACLGPRVGTFVSNVAGGEVQLAGAFGDEYDAALGPQWTSGSWTGAAYAPAPANGILSIGGVNGAYVRSTVEFPVTSFEARAQFGAAPWMHLGWAALDFASDQYFIFSTFNQSSRLYARTNRGNGETLTDVGAIPVGFHSYRVEATPGGGGATQIRYLIDGVVVATHTVMGNMPSLHVYQSHNSQSATPTLDIDALSVSPPFTTAGTFDSCVLDAGAPVTWSAATWTASVPAGTTLSLSTRTSDDASTWSAWSLPLTASGQPIVSPAGRYAQYRLSLTTSDPATSPVVASVALGTAPADGQPVAVNDATSTPLDTAVTIAALANDSDPDGDPLTISSVATPARGTASIVSAGTAILYTPTTGLCGPDTFAYVVSDGRGGSAQAFITVTVGCPANLPPTAVDDTAATPFNTAVTVSVLGNDSDPNGDALVVSSVSGALRGTATVGVNGLTVVYTPIPGLCGVDTVAYVVSDGQGGTATATITITVACTTGLTQSSVVDFTACTPSAIGTRVTRVIDGEVQLAGSFADDYAAGVGPQWTSGTWTGGAYTPVVESGVLSLGGLQGAFVRSTDALAVASLEARAQFSGAPWQHVGWAALDFAGPYFVFSTFNQGTRLYARSNAGAGETTTDVGPIPAGFHTYEVALVSGTDGSLRMRYTIDGAVVAEHPLAGALPPLHVYQSHNSQTATPTLDVDAIVVSPPFTTAGLFDSCVLDAGVSTGWGSASWVATVPESTGLLLSVRTSENATTWSGWSSPVSTSGAAIAVPPGRYAQYRLDLSTTNPAVSPIIESVTLTTDASGGVVPTITIGAASVVEGQSGLLSLTFPVTLSEAASRAVSVTYATSGGNAGAGTDYTPTSGTLNFAAGETTADIVVPVIGDLLDEADETFTVVLSAPVNATLAAPVGTGTILDDDAAPGVSIGDVSVVEGDTGTSDAVFTITLSAASGQPLSVDYTTVDGTAVAGSDYVAAGGTATLAPGTLTRTIVVPIVGDTVDEQPETFSVALSAPVNVTIGDGNGTGSIADNDIRSLSIADVSVTETNAGSISAVFTVSLSAASSQTVSVTYATATGTAAADSDYTTDSGTVTFTPGTLTQTIAIAVLGDTRDENDETFSVTLSGPVNATITTGAATGTIVDNDATPSLSIGTAAVTEGDVDSTDVTLTVTLSAASGRPVTVDYSTAGGTATAGVDFVPASGTLSFAEGVTTQTIVVAVLGDVLNEANETFVVTLANPTNATLGTATRTVTITDNDPLPTLAIDDVTVTEEDSGTVPAVFTVTLSAVSGRAVTVDYATAAGTAAASSDYTTTSGTLTFPAGTLTQTITVPVVGGVANEVTESFTVTLSAAGNATIADGDGTGTIIDNDGLPSIVINNSSVTEGNNNLTFTVTLSPASGQMVTVAYATSNGTATSGTDYTAASGSVSFTPGATSRTFTVPILADSVDEDNETIVVTLSGATNATIADDTGVGTINDNDGTPSLRVGNASLTEGDTGSSTATFVVTLSAASGRTVTVNYASASGTAVAGADFTAVGGTLTFAPGVTAQSVDVAVVGDLLDEPNETFTIGLSGAVNASIADASGLGTINDNDPTPTLVIDDVTVTEGDSGSVLATFTVTLSAASGRTVTVRYATANVTAVAGSDYTSTSGTLTFAAGTTTQTVTVTVLSNTVAEGTETFRVNLSSATNATIADAIGTGTILDND